MLGRVIAVAAGAAIGSVATASAATPSVVPGWPVAAGTGSLHAGPGGGGVVVVSDGFSGDDDPGPISTAAAFRLTGVRRWINTTRWGCGNCDDGLQPPERQPDGSYGPIGPDGDGIWAITSAGARVAGCSGVLLTDGTCISHAVGVSPSGTPRYPVVTASRGSTVVWRYERPTLSWTIESESLTPPQIVRDQSGTVYTQFGAGNEPAGTPVPARMISLNEATGALRSQVDNASPQAAFTAGVVAYRPGTGLVRYAADGTVAWTNASWTDINFWRVRVDEARKRIYVSPQFPNRRPTYVAALDSETGVEVWRTRAIDAAQLLSVGPTGTVYASVVSGSRFGLRAIGPTGVGRFQWETSSAILSARELPDRTVALSTEGNDSFRRDCGLLVRINPTRPAAAVSTARFALSQTRFSRSCTADDCRFDPKVGTILRIAVPARAAVRVRILRRDGSVLDTIRPERFSVPAGLTHARIMTGRPGIVGRRLIEIRAVVRGRAITQRFPVTIR